MNRREQIGARVRSIINEHLHSVLYAGPVTIGCMISDDVSLTDDLAFDSLDLIDVSMEIEGALGVALDFGEVMDAKTVGELIDCAVASACNAAAEAA